MHILADIDTSGFAVIGTQLSAVGDAIKPQLVTAGTVIVGLTVVSIAGIRLVPSLLRKVASGARG